MTTAFLFPGQGSQTPGMGEAFYEAWPEMRRAFDRLDEATDLDLHALCFGADADRLRQTEHTQPAVYAVGVAVAAAVRERYDAVPDVVSGHSLGHFTAAAHAGLFAPGEGLDLVARRGAAMAAAGREDGPGRMVAVLLADPGVVADVCAGIEGASVAAFNTPRQTVVSGDADAVEAACGRIEERTRARATDLDVGAAFHSPVMRGAVDDVAAAVDGTQMDAAQVPIVSDVSGEAYTDPEVARADLRRQVTSPVDWRAAVETLTDLGVERFVEFPPAGTLAGFLDSVEGTVVALEAPADADETFAD